MKRCIIYARKSTNKQSAETIETQINECKKWAEQNDCVVVDIYDDSGQSGRSYNTKNRSGFQQIKEDAKNGRMDYALIHKVDRFARNAADYFIQERALEEYGVKVIVVGMPFLQDADIVVKALYIGLAEHFSNNLSNEVTAKMRTFAEKGAFLGGTPPYGFIVGEKDGKKTLIPDPEKSIAIKLMYDLYLQGFGCQRVAEKLAERGFLNQNGQMFEGSRIAKMLRNKVYNGAYVYGKRHTVNGKRSYKPKGAKDIIVISNVYEKIVDDETFNAAIEKLDRSMPKNNFKKRHYPLTGLIVCDICGRAFTGCVTNRKVNGKDLVYTYYRCNGRKAKNCPMRILNAEKIEKYIAEKIQEYLFNDEFIELLIKEIESSLSGDVVTFRNIKKEIEAQIEQIDNSIKNAMRDKYAGKTHQQQYEEVVAEFDRDKINLEIRLYNINQQINISDKTDKIRKYVKWLRKNLLNAGDDVINVFLRQTVNLVVVKEDVTQVYVHLTTKSEDDQRRSFGSPTMTTGTPTITLDKKINVYAEDGLNLAAFNFDTNLIAKRRSKN